MIDDFNLQQIIEPLQDWFSENARTLPWREDPTPYHVWISEIMLQQTRVEAVKGYYDRFLRELSDIPALAACPDDRLMKLWEGLGYYNRARNLKIAANQILEEYDGQLPEEFEELLKIRGIGHYTAGAIASLAYEKRVPAVDGNVLRVISRVTADDSDIMKQSVRSHMEDVLRKLMEENASVRPRLFNQGLMELGAIVCVPNGEPLCDACPWNGFCRAHREEKIGEIPVKKKPKERRIEERTVLLVRDAAQIAIRKRPKNGLLAGLYEFPNLEGYQTEADVLRFVESMGYQPLHIRELTDAKHIFSHIEWHMKGYMIQVADLQFGQNETIPLHESAWSNEPDDTDQRSAADWIFIDTEELQKTYAVPAAFARYASYIVKGKK